MGCVRGQDEEIPRRQRYWPRAGRSASPPAATKANTDTRTWPAATTSGCTAGGAASDGRQSGDRSQPSMVRTQSTSAASLGSFAHCPSIRHDNRPAKSNKKAMPRIERMGEVGALAPSPRVQPGGKERRMREELSCGERDTSATRRAFTARRMPVGVQRRRPAKTSEKTGKKRVLRGCRRFSVWPKSSVAN